MKKVVLALKKYSVYSTEEIVVILMAYEVKHKGKYKRFPISLCYCSISGHGFRIFIWYDPTIKNSQLLLRENCGNPSKLYLGQILQEEAWIV